MRLTSARAYSRPAPVPTMPPGLMELMNGLAKDVLRHNPANVYEFCANHMEKLLQIRDGPSSKTRKSMTLEQKIENAQEKIRQRAKERREKFDREMNLFHGQQISEQDKENVPVDQESSSSLAKALVHHKVDLQNASEVEISHVEGHVTEINDNKSNPEESKQILLDSVSFESKLEPRSLEVQSEPKKDLEEVDVKDHKKVVDIPIFEKVESELTNEPLKEPELKNIAELHVGDSSLQTITEASEETLVNDNVAVLPKITIGDGPETRELKNFSGESFTETRVDNVAKAESEVMKPSDVQNETDKSKRNTVPHSDTDFLSSNGPESTSTAENIACDVNLCAENKTEITSTNDKSELTDEQMTEAAKKSQNLTDVSGDGVIQQTDDGDYSNIGSSTEHKNADQKLELPSVETKLPGVTVEPPKDDVCNDKIQNEKQPAVSVVTREKLNVSEKNEATSVEINATENTINVHDNETGNQVSDSKISDNNNVYAETIENKSEKEIINSDTEKPLDSEKAQDNSESSFPKSESNEITNEDSMSIIESDISKTDEETNQNNPNMDLETAAVTIQKVFRSFMFKSRNSTFEESINDENNSVDEDNDKKEEYYAAANLNKERRTLGITRMESVLQTVNEEKSLSLSTDDSSTLSSAATTIQAHVRGFLVRNRFNSSKTFSMNSLVNSHEVLESDPEQHKNKTILNIHIVPEEGNFLSRDESLITSMDLSLDGSPPSSVNLHSMSCDISERRKMLKREDAIQSVSPPSNNSGKLSQDSVKEVLINETSVLGDLTDDITMVMDDHNKELDKETSDVVSSASTVTPTTVITISKSEDLIRSPRENSEGTLRRNVNSCNKLSSDESDVITAFALSPRSSEDGSLLHSGEFHDVVLPTQVSRNDTPVVREFKNVLVYFLLWNSS